MEEFFKPAKIRMLENLKELAEIKEYPDTKSNSAMRIAVMNAEAVTIQALMSVEEREAIFFKTCAKVAEDILEGMNKVRGDKDANQN